jgi:hypothetical protein
LRCDPRLSTPPGRVTPITLHAAQTREGGDVGFSIRLAPGLRISASSRGLRTSIGPRSARLHLGAGAPGFSTGAGPVSFYTSLGAGRGRRRPSATAYQRQLAAQATLTANLERVQHARMLAESFQRLLNLHRVDFPPARPPFAPAPAQPDRKAIHRHYLREALVGIGRWSFGERREAKSRAQEWTEVEAQRQWTEACQERADLQAHLDKRWQLLCANHPDVVRETLEEAFEDNEAPSAAAGVEAGEATLVVLVPTVDGAVPDQMPTTTRAGNLTLRDLSQSDRADYYKLYVCGQALVTVREAFAVAPAYARPGWSCCAPTTRTPTAGSGCRACWRPGSPGLRWTGCTGTPPTPPASSTTSPPTGSSTRLAARRR